MRILHLDESLEEKVAELRRLSGHPVYIVNGSWGLDLKCYLHLEDWVQTLRIAIVYDPSEVEAKFCGKVNKRFSLIEDRESLLPKQMTDSELRSLDNDQSYKVGEWYREVALWRDTNCISVSTEGYNVPELAPYVRTRIKEGAEDPYIKFYVSELIARPVVRQEKWHLSNTIGKMTKECQLVLPPGQYNTDPPQENTRDPRYCMFYTDPGVCIVCHGASDESQHFGISTNEDEETSICEKCAKKAFEEWGKLF